MAPAIDGAAFVIFEWSEGPEGTAAYVWEYRKDYEDWPVGDDHRITTPDTSVEDYFTELGEKYWRVWALDAAGQLIGCTRELTFEVTAAP